MRLLRRQFECSRLDDRLGRADDETGSRQMGCRLGWGRQASRHGRARGHHLSEVAAERPRWNDPARREGTLRDRAQHSADGVGAKKRRERSGRYSSLKILPRSTSTKTPQAFLIFILLSSYLA